MTWYDGRHLKNLPLLLRDSCFTLASASLIAAGEDAFVLCSCDEVGVRSAVELLEESMSDMVEWTGRVEDAQEG